MAPFVCSPSISRERGSGSVLDEPCVVHRPFTSAYHELDQESAANDAGMTPDMLSAFQEMLHVELGKVEERHRAEVAAHLDTITSLKQQVEEHAAAGMQGVERTTASAETFIASTASPPPPLAPASAPTPPPAGRVTRSKGAAKDGFASPAAPALSPSSSRSRPARPATCASSSKPAEPASAASTRLSPWHADPPAAAPGSNHAPLSATPAPASIAPPSTPVPERMPKSKTKKSNQPPHSRNSSPAAELGARTVKRVGYNQYKLEKVKEKFKVTLTAMRAHVRILSNNKDYTAVMLPPVQAVLDNFRERFTESAEDRAANLKKSGKKLGAIVNPVLGIYYLPGSGLGMPFNIGPKCTEFMAREIARAGLPAWRPSFHEPADSYYNTAHRLLALGTFKQSAHALGYAGLGHVVLPNDLDLEAMYNHVVHYEEAARARSETRTPGFAVDKKLRDMLRTRRDRLLVRRFHMCEGTIYAALFNKALYGDGGLASDDEDTTRDVNGIPVSVTKARATLWRSACEETFVSKVDLTIANEAALGLTKTRGPKPLQRLRLPAQDRQPAILARVPRSLTIDRYSPEFYNGLSNAAKKKLDADTGRLSYPAHHERIVFPGGTLTSLLNQDDVGVALYEEYGAEVLKRYALRDDEGDSDDDADWDEAELGGRDDDEEMEGDESDEEVVESEPDLRD